MNEKGEIPIIFEFQQIEKSSINVGNVICCEKFVYGIFYPNQQNEIFVGYWSENIFKAHLREGLKRKIAIDSYEKARGKALFLVVSMELIEVSMPEDVQEDQKYIGINVKCIRLENNNKFFHNSERIFFTLHHPMSSLSIEEDEIKIVGRINLPTYWNEKIKDRETVEKPL